MADLREVDLREVLNREETSHSDEDGDSSIKFVIEDGEYVPHDEIVEQPDGSLVLRRRFKQSLTSRLRI
ncbi:MAG: hypothetical protein LiPW16_453 [Microgenomates group bacterium LiPW_16]|nr:MAG: hypothetical protein LiPW16_453 [Microgenomates group bacterium LiPW_16]